MLVQQTCDVSAGFTRHIRIIEGASDLVCSCTSSPFTVSSKTFDLKTNSILKLEKASFNPMSCHMSQQTLESIDLMSQSDM